MNGFSLKSIALLFILTLSFSGLNAQNDNPTPDMQAPKSDFWKHVRFGGNIGIGAGNGFFSATIAPQAIYQFDKTFGLGVGLNATFNNRKNRYNSTILGGSIIAIANAFDFLQLSAEFEELNVNQKFKGDFSGIPKRNFWNEALFLGLGIRTGGGMIIGARYNVLHDDEDGIYSDAFMPFVRVLF